MQLRVTLKPEKSKNFLFSLDVMRVSLINAIQVSAIVGSVPKYGAVGNYACSKSTYYYATTFFTNRKSQAHQLCKAYDCDIIIEWTSKKGYKGWDIGRLDKPACPQNTDQMDAIVIWGKQVDSDINSNNTYAGEIIISWLISSVS